MNFDVEKSLKTLLLYVQYCSGGKILLCFNCQSSFCFLHNMFLYDKIENNNGDERVCQYE